MKRKLLFITLVMTLFAVQGYAQRERHSERRMPRTEQRRHEQRSTYSHSRPERGRPQEYARPRQEKRHPVSPPSRRSYENRPRAPQPMHHHRPHYQSHYEPHHRPHYRSHHVYPYRFNDWRWYSWRGYHNRFVCHSLHHNHFFDTVLGYYLWGSLNAPTRLEIGNMVLTRYNRTLKIKIGNQYSYLDVYRPQNVCYQIGETLVNISTQNGQALVKFYDEYGNNATYSL